MKILDNCQKKHQRRSIFLNKYGPATMFIKKDISAQVFFCEC